MVQSFNLAGVLYFPYARFIRKSFLIPHFWVKNINNIDIEKLKFYGFEGLVFDKDNTLTEPYTEEISQIVKDTFDQCKDLYKDRVLIVSNHSGTNDDPDYIKAMTVEERLGVPVLRHGWKKPFAGRDTIDYFTKVLGHECDRHGTHLPDRILNLVCFDVHYNLLCFYSHGATSCCSTNSTNPSYPMTWMPSITVAMPRVSRSASIA